MKRFKLSPEAAQDIREIWAFLAKDSIKAARQVRLRIFEACGALAQNPHSGHRREDLTDKALLFWPTGSYVIVYKSSTKPIEIVRVLHGARNISALLDSE
jgi:plasmid stabilization system protein ParE